jgi:hypothetical protein
MSDEEDSSEEERVEYEREKEKRVRIKPWERRLRKWPDKNKQNAAAELLAISLFFASIPRDDIRYGLFDSLKDTGHDIPVSEMKKIIEWWHTDTYKRKRMNKLLEIHGPKCGWLPEPHLDADGWDRKIGPEHQIAKGWRRLDDAQRAYLKSCVNVTPVDAWVGMHPLSDEGFKCPVPTWSFVEEYIALIKKHKAE